MGWSFDYVDIGREAHIERLTGARHYSPDYEPLEHRVVGNNVWQLILHKPTGRKLITLNLIAKARGKGWGYKNMTEDCGPCQVNCPLSLLNKASPVTEADGYAFGWRQKVREYHAKHTNKPKPTAGMVITYDGHQYRLDAPYAPRKGWRVTRVSDGTRFRMKAKELSTALSDWAEVNRHD